MSSTTITVIDIEEGTPAQGYAIRVGAEVSKVLRLAGCYNASTRGLIRTASGAYVQGDKFTLYASLSDAIVAAISLKNMYPGYKIRVDCTVA